MKAIYFPREKVITEASTDYDIVVLEGVNEYYDTAGANVVASGHTDVLGQVTFMLDSGTYYLWRQKAGYNFTNPDTEVVA